MTYDQGVPCENCGHEGTKTGLFQCHVEGGPVFDRVPKNYCQVCSSTFLSSATNYPSQCSDVKLYKSIGWIANEILRKIEAK